MYTLELNNSSRGRTGWVFVHSEMDDLFSITDGLPPCYIIYRMSLFVRKVFWQTKVGPFQGIETILRTLNIRTSRNVFLCEEILKGIVSAPTIFTYIIEWGSRTKNNILLSSSELDLTLKFSFLSQISRNSCQWKLVTQSKTCQWKVVTNPKLVSKKWLLNPNPVSKKCVPSIS